MSKHKASAAHTLKVGDPTTPVLAELLYSGPMPSRPWIMLNRDGGSDGKLKREPFDVIVGNPPFNQDLEGLLSQYIDRAREGARVVVVVPEGFLFRRKYFSLRARLLTECNLTDVVRLPESAFPKVKVRTYVLRIESGTTSQIMFGEVCAAWSAGSAFKPSVRQAVNTGADLSPSSGTLVAVDQLGPELLLALDVPRSSSQLEYTRTVSEYFSWPLRDRLDSLDTGELERVALTHVLHRTRRPLGVEDDEMYHQLSIGKRGQGAYLRAVRLGKEIKTKRQFLVKTGDLVISRLDAREGGIAIVPRTLDASIVSDEYWVFKVTDIPSELVLWALTSEASIASIGRASFGTTGRVRIRLANLMEMRVAIPSNEVDRLRIIESVRLVQNLG